MTSSAYPPNPSEIDVIPLGGFEDNIAKSICVRVVIDTGDMWNWCKQNVATGTWKYMFPLVGTGASYIFKNELDALAFKLRINIYEY
jgi:hypothetical protein